jgi:hypothetical protein
MKSLIVMFDIEDDVITQVKYGDFEYLLELIEHYVIMAMKVKERCIFFKVESDEYEHVTYLMDHSLLKISYLKNFKNAQYKG